jgi:hypothetical protein
MRNLLATLAIMVSFTVLGEPAHAQNPYRGNGVNGIYTSGWPIYGNYIHGDYIHGTYIAPPSLTVYYPPVQNYVPVQPMTWTYTAPTYYYPNYSSVIPTNYNYNWRYYGR